MQTFSNRAQFTNALEYIGGLFSKPYSITPIVDRWFSQLSMIQLEDGKIVHLSGDVAKAHIDIRVDGDLVDKKDIGLVFKFYSQQSDYEKERGALVKRRTEITAELAALRSTGPLVDSEKISILETQTTDLEEKIKNFDTSKEKAKTWYEKIIKSGVASLNVESLEKKFKSKLANIIHRPNHGIAHSVRAAYSIPNLLSFREKNGLGFKGLDEASVEKLQLMMLFSVVGRKDETGFNDTGNSVVGGRAVYEGFRATSGREYLKYCREHAKHLYDLEAADGLEQIYRDAIIVELMGYSSIVEAVKNRTAAPPQLFVDYVMEKRKCTESDARLSIVTNEYNLASFFSGTNELSDAKIKMMQDAHGLDLTRCYPLYLSREGGAKSLGIFNYHLAQAAFYDVTADAREEKLTSVFNLMRCSFDTLVLTGQRTMFGLLSKESYETQKSAILLEVKAISDEFISQSKGGTKWTEAMAARKDIEAYLGRVADDSLLLARYRQYLILRKIADRFTDAPKLNADEKMFAFHQPVLGDPSHTNDRQSALHFVEALQTVDPYPGVTRLQLPVVERVKHDVEHNLVELCFDSAKASNDFIAVCREQFPAFSNSAVHANGQYVLTLARDNYLKLKEDRLFEFKLATVPAKVEREEHLVDCDGNIDALRLIADSHALGRLVSTNTAKGRTHPEYEYLFKALDDPAHER